MHGKLIPNSDPVGTDTVLTPVVVNVPLILLDNGTDFLWYPEAMDASAADRIMAMSMAGGTVAAYRVTVPIVLPAAQEIESATAAPERLVCEPVRIQMRAP